MSQVWQFYVHGATLHFHKVCSLFHSLRAPRFLLLGVGRVHRGVQALPSVQSYLVAVPGASNTCSSCNILTWKRRCILLCEPQKTASVHSKFLTSMSPAANGPPASKGRRNTTITLYFRPKGTCEVLVTVWDWVTTLVHKCDAMYCLPVRQILRTQTRVGPSCREGWYARSNHSSSPCTSVEMFTKFFYHQEYNRPCTKSAKAWNETCPH